jgi:hypothetical protein
MTGYPEYNYPAFDAASKWLREQGWEVESPHENPPPENPLPADSMWQYYMDLCEKQIELCEAIIFLKGWPESRGALQEFNWALDKGHRVYCLYENLTGPKYMIIPMN